MTDDTRTHARSGTARSDVARAGAGRFAGGAIERTVAFAGPMPPTPSGIATYDRAVVDGLRRIGFTERSPVETIWPVSHRHHAAIRGYRVGVYQLGNNVEHHLDVYRLAWSYPGLVVLHDLALDDFVRGLQASGDMLGIVATREALGAHHALAASGFDADGPLRMPWSAAIARHARGVLVHAPFAARYLEAYGCRTPIFVVPHPPVETAEALEAASERGRALRATVAADAARFLVVAAGDMNEAKQLGAVARAVATSDRDVHLAVVGRRVPTHDVDAELRPAALGNRLRVHADVTDEDFLGWLAAADVIVDLRSPHRGEVSGTLVRAKQLGRATIVSDTGTYADEEPGTVVPIAAGAADASELSARLRELLHDDATRRAIGDAARTSMERLAETDATAHGYAAAIDATAALVHDPVAAPMHRWARSLVEIGVTRAELARGWGRKYADALESFKRSS